MRSKTMVNSILLLVMWISIPGAQSAVFDITAAPYGATADEKTDIMQPLLGAWRAACGTAGATTVTIPNGTYLLGGPITLEGPCQGSIELQVQGKIKAPPGLKGDTWVLFNHIDEFTMSGGGTFDGQGQGAWTQSSCASNPVSCASQAYNLRFNFLNKATIQDITSVNSKNFHINVLGCNDITLKGLTVTAPASSPNTDGIHVGKSKNVNILDTNIGSGDDCISIGDGTLQLHVTNVKCGPGHGISVGSLGRYVNEEPVAGVFVTNCTLTNTLNGVRVKSWPGMEKGSATDLHFEDITMNDVQNPIIIDQSYCPHGKCSKSAASKVKLSNISFKHIKGTTSSPVAVQLLCSPNNPCETVELVDIDLKNTGAGAASSQCANVVPKISGIFTPTKCAV